MKTQIITAAFAIALSMSLNESVANDNFADKSKSPDLFQEQSKGLEFEATIMQEESLNIEDWMVDEKLWKIDSEERQSSNLDQEGSISIESWMYSNDYFRIEDTASIESWMLDSSLWRL